MLRDRLRGMVDEGATASKECLTTGMPPELTAGELVSELECGDAAVRSAAGDLLVRSGEGAIAALAAGIVEGGDRTKLLSVHALVRIGGAAAARVILETLTWVTDANVLHAAIEGCLTLGIRESTPILHELARRDPWLRFGAVRAICLIDGPGLIGRLTAYMEDELVCAEIMDAMRSSGDRGFVLPLLEIATGGTALVSMDARLDAARTIVALLELAGDPVALQCAQRLENSLERGASEREAIEAASDVLGATGVEGRAP